MISREQLLTVTVLFLTSTIQDANASGRFITSPSNITVNPGEEAVFRCHHSEAAYYRWRVNGTLVKNSRLPMGIRLGISNSEPGVHLLIVTGNEDYNQTEIVCIARFDNDNASEPEQVRQASQPAYLNVSSTFVTTSTPSPSFTILPSKMIVPEMTTAIFECQLRSAVISWSFNGTLLTEFNPPNIRRGSKPGGGSIIELLVVHAHPEYNETTIGCIGFYTDGRQTQYSPEVYLIIQGPLSAVTNIERYPQAAILTWSAPFSLNLTNAEPDIIYCVKVINKTCSNNNILINRCNVSEPYLEHETLSDADLFKINITPKSNVSGAQAGLKRSIQEQYIHFNVSAIFPVVRRVSDQIVDVTVYLRTNSLINEVPPNSFIISLESLEGSTFRNFTAASKYSTIYTDSLEVHISNVPYGDLWNCTIYATRCGGLKVSDITTLSTFDIQDIQVTMNGSLIVKCALINGSQAAGVLIVAYSISDIPDIYYRVVRRKSIDQQEIQANISCLPGQSYNILLYVINENGLPQESAASLPLTRSFNNQQSIATNNIKDMCTEQEIAYNISNQGGDVCIECHEPCVAIVHHSISQINVTNGFLNISQIVLINMTTENETVFGCIHGIDLIDYQIGIISVISLNKNAKDMQPPDDNYRNSTQTTNSVSKLEDENATVTVVSSVLATAVVIAGGAIAIIIIVIIALKRRKGGSSIQGTHHEGYDNIALSIGSGTYSDAGQNLNSGGGN